jgi:hypothetical protein
MAKKKQGIELASKPKTVFLDPDEELRIFRRGQNRTVEYHRYESFRDSFILGPKARRELIKALGSIPAPKKKGN